MEILNAADVEVIKNRKEPVCQCLPAGAGSIYSKTRHEGAGRVYSSNNPVKAKTNAKAYLSINRIIEMFLPDFRVTGSGCELAGLLAIPHRAIQFVY